MEARLLLGRAKENILRPREKVGFVGFEEWWEEWWEEEEWRRLLETGTSSRVVSCV